MEQNKNRTADPSSFSAWLLRKRGYKYFFTPHLIIYGLLGAALAYFSKQSLDSVSTALALPMLALVVGMAFAISGNCFALMQTRELELVFRRSGRSLENEVAYYQGVIAIVLITVGCFGGAALKIPFTDSKLFAGLTYALLCFSLYECWSVVDSIRFLMVYRQQISDAEEAASDTNSGIAVESYTTPEQPDAKVNSLN